MMGCILAGADADTSPFYEHWKQFHPKINSLRDASGWGVGKKYQIFMVILRMPCCFFFLSWPIIRLFIWPEITSFSEVTAAIHLNGPNFLELYGFVGFLNSG